MLQIVTKLGGFYIRFNQIYPFNKKLEIKIDDIIIIFTKSYLEESVKNWIYNL